MFHLLQTLPRAVTRAPWGWSRVLIAVGAGAGERGLPSLRTLVSLSQAVSMGSWPILGFFCGDETVRCDDPRCWVHGGICFVEQHVGTHSGKDEEQWEQ